MKIVGGINGGIHNNDRFGIYKRMDKKYAGYNDSIRQAGGC